MWQGGTIFSERFDPSQKRQEICFHAPARFFVRERTIGAKLLVGAKDEDFRLAHAG
jgi:hypothetical protein